MNLDYFNLVATIATIASSGAIVGTFILDVFKLVIVIARRRRRRREKKRTSGN